MNLLHLMLLIAVLAIVAVTAVARVLANGSATKQTRVRPQRVKSFKRQWRKIHLLPIGLQRLRSWIPGTRGCGGEVQFANIGEGTSPNGVKTYLPDANTTSRYLCYKIGTDGDHCAITGAGDTPLGQSDDQADTTLGLAVNLFGVKPGTLRVVTDGTIANGDHVKCGATGKVTKASTTDRSFGIALIGTDTSSADGDVITIVHCVPHLYVF